MPARRSARANGLADGQVPDGTTVFADIPAVVNLNAKLLASLRRAATDAADVGVELELNSGWRSSGYQERLFKEAVATYGSDADAARWVARPGTSVHEAGKAVDIGPSSAAAWLAEHGASFGLCQVYDNEPWHFERRGSAAVDGCPTTYADPTDDPRMQQ
ncbi:M15 family metallopeptidase [Mumia sp. DW29H23]|uniref:M15 family metallopeptidase n=1 Tax=Mumia sp. DW29H23 TaxID=3421241 RepID=UPI003D682DC6